MVDQQAADPPRSRPHPYLTHVDGLRGIAIALVVIFHVFVGRVSSGVDVFLFLGGLLFLTSQMRNAQRPGGPTIGQSIIRLARRLVPALVVVVATMLGAVMLFWPQSAWSQPFENAAAAVAYVANYWLAANTGGYDAVDGDAPLFQHLWSMSVQLQIYLLILVAVYVSYRLVAARNARHRRWRRTIIAIVAAATAASFIYALVLHQVGLQDLNYYSTLARFWEIGLGALFGLVVYSLNGMHPATRTGAFVLGIAAILFTGLFLDGAQEFPGPWTLVPLAGAALVIVSGVTEPDGPRGWRDLGPVKLLETPPFVWLGTISYALYLWHWPLLLLVLSVTPAQPFSAASGITVIALSLVLAWFTHLYVEKPLRQRGKPERRPVLRVDYVKRALSHAPNAWYPVTAALAVVGVAAIATSPLSFGAYQKHQANQILDEVDGLGGYEEVYKGARVNFAGEEAPEGVPIFPPAEMGPDGVLDAAALDGCVSDFDSTTVHDDEDCWYGDTDADETLYLVGGSHSEHYLPALDLIGKERGFKIVTYLKVGCPLYFEEKIDGTYFEDCMEWSADVEKTIMADPPSLGVFMVSTRPTVIDGGGVEQVPDFYVEVFKRFSDAGIHIFGARDTVWLTNPDGGMRDPAICVEESEDPMACGEPARASLLPWNPAVTAYRGLDMTHLDVNGGNIVDEWVMTVMGNIRVYRDAHHFTRQYAETLADELDRQMFDDPVKADDLSDLGREPGPLTEEELEEAEQASSKSTSTSSEKPTTSTTPTTTTSAK